MVKVDRTMFLALTAALAANACTQSKTDDDGSGGNAGAGATGAGGTGGTGGTGVGGGAGAGGASLVEGGSFIEGEPCDPQGGSCPTTPERPATIGSFYLDTFEVTVERFREFVEAYPGSRPQPGDGAHPLIADSGWRAEWDEELKLPYVSSFELEAALKSCTAEGEPEYSYDQDQGDTLPIDCVNWHEAFAFCAWDGGRLPTEAEWEYAAAGGSEERTYPWGEEEPWEDHANWACGQFTPECAPPYVIPVGSKPAGRARWGHHDMAGNVQEWVLDVYLSVDGYEPPEAEECDNCAVVSDPNDPFNDGRHNRGSNWNSWDAYELHSAVRNADVDSMRNIWLGLRCARDEL